MLIKILIVIILVLIIAALVYWICRDDEDGNFNAALSGRLLLALCLD